MKIDYLHIAVVVLFFIQLFSISIYVSLQWRANRTQLFANYPQSHFPNLYVRPESEELKRLSHRKRLDYFAAFIGLIVLTLSLVFRFDTVTLSRSMIMVAGIQVLPLLLSGYWCTKNSQAMKARYPEKIRHATLGEGEKNTIFAAFSSVSVILFVICLIIASMVNGSIQNSDIVSSIEKLRWLNVFMFIVMSAMILSALYGKKTDNFATPSEYEDRRRSKLNYLSISFCIFQIFILIIIAAKVFDLNSVFIAMLTSLIVQGIILSTREQYFPINPHVYK